MSRSNVVALPNVEVAKQLVSANSAMLDQKGIFDDYRPDLPRVCPYGKCEGDGAIRGMSPEGYDFVKPCVCHKERQFRIEQKEAGIPEGYRRFTLRDSAPGREPFVVPPGSGNLGTLVRQLKFLKGQYARLKKFSRRSYPSLVVSGTCGSGKTRAVVSLVNDLITLGVTGIKYFNAFETRRELIAAINDGQRSELSLTGPLERAKLLVLDDVNLDEDGMHSAASRFVELIGLRYDSGRPTIIITNYTDPALLRLSFTGRIYNRLIERADWVTLQNVPDFRQEAADARKRGDA